jgi:hypothetical protein
MPATYLGSGWRTVGSTPVVNAEFTTHSNYLNFISGISGGLTINIPAHFSAISNTVPVQVTKKVGLTKLVMKNIDSEMDQINQFRDYAQICSSWIPVKSYYLFFNLLLILEWLIDDDISWLSNTHEAVNHRLKELIRNNEIIFNEPYFNSIIPATRTSSWMIPSGSNIVIGNPDPRTRYRQVIKKILDYKKDDFKRRRNIKRLTGANNTNFLTSTDLNLWEFLYWYRIKANYRDMEFLESGVNVSDFYLYYLNYHTLCFNLHKAFVGGINNISILKYGINMF